MELGALPPEEMAWQEGKTAAGIHFVQTAEKIIARLQGKIDRVKSGDLVITKPLIAGGLEEFLSD